MVSMVKNSRFYGTIYDVVRHDDWVAVACLDSKSSLTRIWRVAITPTNFQIRPGDSLIVAKGVASWTTAQAEYASFKRKRHDKRVGREVLADIRFRIVGEPLYD